MPLYWLREQIDSVEVRMDKSSYHLILDLN